MHGYSNHFYCPCLHQAPRIVVRFLSGDLHLFLFCPTIFKIQILGFQLVAKIYCNARPIFHQILPYSSADTLSHFSQTWQNTILLSLWIVWKRRNRKTFDSEDHDTGSTLRLFGDHLKLWSSRAPKGQPSDHALAWCQQLVGMTFLVAPPRRRCFPREISPCKQTFIGK